MSRSIWSFIAGARQTSGAAYLARFFIGSSEKAASLPVRDPDEISGILRKKAEEGATAVRGFAASQRR